MTKQPHKATGKTQTRPDERTFDKFTRAYIEAALWSSTDDDGGLDRFDWDDIDDNCLEVMVQDCVKFQEANKADLDAAGEVLDSDYTCGAWPLDAAGHDFWLSRNGHGVGFFDRNLGEVGDRLQQAAQKFGDLNLYTYHDHDDDGKVWVGCE
jgi:hypothetical protein